MRCFEYQLIQECVNFHIKQATRLLEGFDAKEFSSAKEKYWAFKELPKHSSFRATLTGNATTGVTLKSIVLLTRRLKSGLGSLGEIK